MASKENRLAKESLNSLKENGFNFSYNSIAKYLTNNGYVKENGIPYDRISVYNSIKSDYTDDNIIAAIVNVSAEFKKGKKRVWKYNQSTGAPKKK